MSVSATDSGQNSHVVGTGRKQAQDPPGSLHSIVSPVEWSSLNGSSPQWEQSVVIHHKKNYQLYKDATCHNLWPCDFTDVTAFSSRFLLAVHYCFFLCIFFLLWLFLWRFNFYQVLFRGWSFSGAPFSPECCFFWMFLWPFLPSSSWCFFFTQM